MIRIGFGYDSHAVDPARTLILGGIKFENISGLKGHSDADVLLHAIIDAILSASGQGDIGEHFPDTDPGYENISSLELLRESIPSDWNIEQIDATVICDQPKILPERSRIIASLKSVLGQNVQITVKGKSTEKLGFLGRGEGIVAFAVALLSK